MVNEITREYIFHYTSHLVPLQDTKENMACGLLSSTSLIHSIDFSESQNNLASFHPLISVIKNERMCKTLFTRLVY